MKRILMAVALAGLLAGCNTLGWKKAGLTVADALTGQVDNPVAVTNVTDNVCDCDLTRPLREPPKSGGDYECSGPMNGEVRTLCWSPKKGDWVFVPHKVDGVALVEIDAAGNVVGRCVPDAGWHYVGQRQKTTASSIINQRAVPYKGATQRAYYQYRGGK